MVVVNYGVELESRDQSVPNRRMRVYMVVSVMGWNQSLYGSLKLYGGARVCGVGVRAYMVVMILYSQLLGNRRILTLQFTFISVTKKIKD